MSTSGSGRGTRIVIVVAILAVVGIAAFFPIALATDRSEFCRSCHTMVPFYDAWATGGHAEHAACIDCHVDAGYEARFTHKFVALKEVYAEFFTKANFPSYNAEIPNERCLRCHPDAPSKVVDKFSHPEHLEKDTQCISCHGTTGHKVSVASLASAGILNAANVTAGDEFIGQNPKDAGTKGSVYPGHKKVNCQNCHDQAKLQCSYCHKTPAKHFGPKCTACHKDASVDFDEFKHPDAGEHDWRKRACKKCHPNGYDTVYCTCHKGKPPIDD
ncbi:MAG: hypothetical protein HGB10_10720 [Coriobacteriia bacterium]|nr:hypothetical protein [Coriobacteriia bacterium]